MRRVYRSIALVALGGLTGCASVSNPFAKTNDFDRTFITAAQTWDVNKDGSVSCDEWNGYVATLVRESDGNGDGNLDATEFATMARTDRLFEVANMAYYDANGDGKTNAAEIAAKKNAAFAILDKNSDCQIDRNETVQVYNVDKPKDKEVDQTIPGKR